ncbi:hypothetical protein AB6A40_000351 [Gnathostoma spinigerum]|uniref:Alpha-MPP n=1 Tax=Gnathostoma spinigerum TaxID=75299 RepID=A0ABD6EB00_9BILA
MRSARLLARSTRLLGRSHLRRYASSARQSPNSSQNEVVKDQTSFKLDKNVINSTPLTEPLKGLGPVKYTSYSDIIPFDTKLTKLESGLQVATEAHYGDYCTIGVAIDSGSRFEASYPNGTSHFIEKLAFTSTPSFNSKEEMFSVLEKYGAIIDCQSTKETFIFAASCHISGVEQVLTIIADAVHRPLFSEQELNDARQIVEFENTDMNSKPECEPLLTDWVHSAAYNGNTLGFSKYCPPPNVHKITRQHLYSYMSQYHTPSRIAVGGIGVDHKSFVDASVRLFDPSKTIWATEPSLCLPDMPDLDESLAQYTGGELRVAKDLSHMALGPAPFPNLAHFVLGFESCGYKDDDFIPSCVLQTLMGGGGSFSAGGPGKGMYTRLYVDVLNKCHYMYNATAYNQTYKDSGIFYIHASSEPRLIGETARVIVNEFLRLSKGTEAEELERAKTQLKSQLMMNLEMRPVMFEDLVRQVIGHGFRRKPQEYLDKIDAVTNDDIVRFAERMLSTIPTVVGYGDLAHLPSYQKICQAMAKRSVDELRKSRVFGF